MMQSEDRKRKKHSLNPRSVSDEYSLRERPKDEATKMKNKVSTSQAASGKKKPWSWDQYLEDERSQAAPLQLFTEFQAFPDSRNGFKVGMRLEGIDPLHPSMFCVLSVAEVIGFRLRLHIDGYSECYDFWVNADAPDVKPAGWCESTGHKLHPPKGYKQNEFNWEKYLEACNAQAAPENLFRSSESSGSVFEVGMKLEAVDRKNPCLVCVASVADIVDQRFLVHFDNWDDTYDYWCDASSPYIHPVGWCQDHGRPLTAPQGENHIPHAFSVTAVTWCETIRNPLVSSTIIFQNRNLPGVSRSAMFQVLRGCAWRSPHGFQTHMKLEAVDRRNPMLIRVATVADTEDHRVQVHFDGWHEKFDFWVDSDLPDLHPVGWCSRTGHPLEPPLRESLLALTLARQMLELQYNAFGCPYSDMNMKKEVVLPDRLGGEKQITFIPVTKRLCPDEEEEEEEEEEEDGSEEISHVDNREMMAACDGAPRLRGRPAMMKKELKDEPLMASLLGKRAHLPSRITLADVCVCLREMMAACDGAPRLRGRPAMMKKELKDEPLTASLLGKRAHLPSRLSQSTKYLRIKDEEDDIDVNSIISERNVDDLQQALHQSVFLSAMSAHPSRDLPLCWEQHCKLLPGVAGVQASRVAHWSVEEVADFIHSLPGCEEQAKQFREEQIDGKAFLLLTQRDIVKIMSMKLGPALKIYNSILMFKHAEDKHQPPAGDT
ncbi:lethal(3)malignant brain tumor-like protein 4 [Sinocyclocheilus grahami]|uniref:lethal(3)malignant brain tumor-like protein 4 n=1 Tax=Sinocyclocheilus grahami TaxID=75366 RepID=UPI0007AC773F|nr:PREDICTED: lethal(3)malignant brain tumor-like protein 4 [Sinocyclocheilus grahami]